MSNPHMSDPKEPHRHLRITSPSPWIARFAPLVSQTVAEGRVLDLAAGGGRHAALFLERGHPVTAVDRVTEPLAWLAAKHGERADIIEADLEDGATSQGGPFGPGGVLAGRTFAAVVVSNYLHRPLLPGLVAAVAPGGLFLYETFARGNETFNRPRNPDHLLKSGELLTAVRGELTVIAYEHGLIQKDAAIPGVIQRIAAERPTPSGRDDGEPDVRDIYPA